jgi:hypothetical protein
MNLQGFVFVVLSFVGLFNPIKGFSMNCTVCLDVYLEDNNKQGVNCHTETVYVWVITVDENGQINGGHYEPMEKEICECKCRKCPQDGNESANEYSIKMKGCTGCSNSHCNKNWEQAEQLSLKKNGRDGMLRMLSKFV